MKRWSWWLVTVVLLCGVFHGGSQLRVSAAVKHRSPTSHVSHSRSLKHNSIASYYRGIHRPAQQTCVEAQLPERVRDAEAIFTGTVRDMVVDGRRAGQTAIVEIKRVIKGDRVLDRFTSSPDQLDHRASRHRRRRRMVAVTGLGDERICRSRTKLYDTWIFFAVVVSDPSSRLRLNSSLTRISLTNILQVEAALRGTPITRNDTGRKNTESCDRKFCAFGAECVVDDDSGRATCRCVTRCDVIVTSDETSSSAVCGSDNRTYASQCQLRAHSCNQRRRIRVRWTGSCESRDPCAEMRCYFGAQCVASADLQTGTCQCPSANDTQCSPDEPVCGDDLRDYRNVCHLRNTSCQQHRQITVKFHGKCDPCAEVQCEEGEHCDLDNVRHPVCRCSDDVTRCADVPFAPVCGSDWTTYPNDCVMKAEACRKQTVIEAVFGGSCNPDYPMGDGCDDLKCGFYATCQMYDDDDDVINEVNTVGSERGRPRCVCPAFCPQVDDPVCGTDGHTYDNECQLQMTSCRTEQLVLVESRGPCDTCVDIYCPNGGMCDRGDCVCPPSCPTLDEPICANDSVTYQNICMMRSAACNVGIELRAVSPGECSDVSHVTQGSLCNGAPCRFGGICQTSRNGRETCVCNFDCENSRSVVCGSDGRLYGSDCLLMEAACLRQSSITVQPLDHCQADALISALCYSRDDVRPYNCSTSSSSSSSSLSRSSTVTGRRRSPAVCPRGSRCHVVNNVPRCCRFDYGRVRTHCSSSEYGCCYDNKTPAVGPQMAGCPHVCHCHSLGSYSRSCDPVTRQCACKTSVGGQRCDRCVPGYWAFALIADYVTGCLPCQCNPFGSVRADCEQATGRCVCRSHVIGHKCDVCLYDGTLLTSSQDCSPSTTTGPTMTSSQPEMTSSTTAMSTSATTQSVPSSDTFMIASFAGSSYLRLRRLQHGHRDIEVEMRFRSLEPTGVLLYTGQSSDGVGDFMALVINANYIEFRYDLGSGRKVLRSEQPITPGGFHRLSAKIHGRDAVMRLDGGRDVSGVSPGNLRSLNVGMPLYLGYVADINDRIRGNLGVSNGLVGCIEYLRIASTKLNIEYDLHMPGSDDIQSAHGIQECAARPCDDESQCLNGAACWLSHQGQYHCQCVDRFTGLRCETKIAEKNLTNTNTNEVI